MESNIINVFGYIRVSTEGRQNKDILCRTVSLNVTYQKLNPQKSVFPSDGVLLKILYLSTFEVTKKIRKWGQIYGELSIMYHGRMPG